MRVELTGNINTIPQRLFIDLKTQAITYYLHYHLQPLEDVPNISKSVCDVFLPICMSRAECPILDLAVSSLALAVFSRTQQHPPAAMEASLMYHRLLQVAQSAFASLSEENIDTCLLAIFFMSRFESAVHRPGQLSLKTSLTTTLQSFSHHDGALAALGFWKDHLSQTYPATDVIKHTRRGMLRSALMRNIALPKWMREGKTFGEHGLELEYDRIVVRIVNARQRLCGLLNEKTDSQRTSPKLASMAEDLNEEVEDIDNALQDWTANFPSTWSYQRLTLSNPHPWPTRDFYSPIVYNYSSPTDAALWNQYYASRMLINSIRWRVLQLENPNSADIVHHQRLECLFHINTTANDLASSVPYCLERFKIADGPYSSSHYTTVTPNANEDIKPYLAGLLIWPLTIASSVRDVDVQQRLWFRSELARLGRMVGTGVFECAETDHWLEL
ncbi:hypothetical protein MMC27_004594 [Xylographa pallens]|nr:hypothetical protein [Xylographa pallens]